MKAKPISDISEVKTKPVSDISEVKTKPVSDINDLVVRNSNELYGAAVARYGNTSAAVLEPRQARQYHRFAELVRYVDLESPKVRVLDVGCGNADLYKYLSSRGFRGRYTGTDINASLVDQAHERFRGIDVRCTDIMSSTLDECFDYVVMSGLFNADYGQTLEWMQAFVRRMFDLADVTMAFNVISTHVNYRDTGFVYLDPAQMLSFCIEQLSKRVTLAHHNLSYNYTVAVFRAQDNGLACEE